MAPSIWQDDCCRSWRFNRIISCWSWLRLPEHKKRKDWVRWRWREQREMVRLQIEVKSSTENWRENASSRLPINSMLTIARFLTSLSRCANLNVERVSLQLLMDGEMLTMTDVLALPPKESYRQTWRDCWKNTRSRNVNFESRYRTCCCLPVETSARALMTFPSALCGWENAWVKTEQRSIDISSFLKTHTSSGAQFLALTSSQIDQIELRLSYVANLSFGKLVRDEMKVWKSLLSNNSKSKIHTMKLTLDWIVRVNIEWLRLLSLFIKVEATWRFWAPLIRI